MKYDWSTEGFARSLRASAAKRVNVNKAPGAPSKRCRRCGGAVTQAPMDAGVVALRGKWACETCGEMLD